MSNITLHGLLILDGDLACSGDILVASDATVRVVPDEALKKSFWSPAGKYIQSSGCGRTISSATGGISIQGLVDGLGLGFGANDGPGSNSIVRNPDGSVREDSSGMSDATSLLGYGATHAGLGAIGTAPIPIPEPRKPYGNRETPVTLGSGSGFFHDPMQFQFWEGSGGSAVKIIARSGIVSIDGTVNMSGSEGIFTGGGAGGSIWVWGWDVTGHGALMSNGGATILPGAGGGGGGYVSMWYEHSMSFPGTVSVAGDSDGKTFTTQVDPILSDKFTGHILNSKWWDTTGAVILDSSAQLTTQPGGFWESSLDSKFTVSGKNITVACDLLPIGPEGEHARAYMRLWSDEYNWVEVSHEKNRIWGRSMEHGLMDEFATTHPYVPTSMRILGTDGTFSYQFWDSTSVAPSTVFTDRIPGLRDRNFTLQLGLRQLSPEDSSVRVDHVRMVSANTAAELMFMDGTPTSLPAMNIVTGTSQLYGLDFYHSGDQIMWDSTGLSMFTPPAGMFVIEHIILTLADVLAKYVTLDQRPAIPSDTAVNIVLGTSQYYGTDFIEYGKTLSWAGLGMDGDVIVGDELVVMYYTSPWGFVVPLSDLLVPGDIVRTMYSLAPDDTTLQAAFDAVRIYDGVISGAETTDPVIYVDPAKGSDSSSGGQLTPLKNLFVATAWAKRGGTVVLYDGTYSPTDVDGKDISIIGAEGADAFVTSSLAQDTTGSGWETSALSFRSCQGLVDNLSVGDGTVGIRIQDSPDFEVRRTRMDGLVTGVQAIDCDPAFLLNTISDANVAFDVSSCTSADLYSNVIYNCEYGLMATDTSDLFVTGNTFDDCVDSLYFEGSDGVASSNNLTWSANVAMQISVDSGISSFNNNFYGSAAIYNGTPDATGGNISVDPVYYDKPTRDYHLLSNSPDIGAGLGTYDVRWYDRDGASRDATPAIGAYEFLDATTHHDVDWYVAGVGDDHRNSGDATSPYRTVDRAMQKADSTVHVDGGHYDSFYLLLRQQNIDLNELTILTTQTDGFVTYVTLNSFDIREGGWQMPGFVTSPSDASNVAVSVVGGGAQMYGLDYIIQYGVLLWNGYALGNLLAEGDTLRIFFGSSLRKKALNTLVLHSHFSNVDIGRMVVASPSGSDSTVLGGDGTNSGGNGSWELPYRTVQAALNASSPGDHIVLRAGEYPMFHPKDGRVIVPYKDRTSVAVGGSFVQDPFSPRDFRQFGATGFDEIPWDFDFTGRSTVYSNGGFLSLAFDGTNVPSATSTFNLFGNWEVQANLRNAIDPINFSVSGPDDTASLRYDGTSYTVSIYSGGVDASCWGTVNVFDGTSGQFVIEEHVITSDDVRMGFFRLQSIPEADDASNLALNISGGTTQNYGDDFVVQDGLVIWRGLELDGELGPGDIARALYVDRRVSGPLGADISLKDGVFKIMVKDPDWRMVGLRNMYGDSSSWKVSFSVSDPNPAINHDVEAGRGFASDFLAVASSIGGTGLSRPLTSSTERRTVIFYNHPDTTRVDDLSFQADGTRTVFRTLTAPVVLGDDGGIVTSDVSRITVTVDGTAVTPLALDGISGRVTLPSAPIFDSTVVASYWTNQY